MLEFGRRFDKDDRHRDARLIASIMGYRYDHAQLTHYVTGIQNAVGPDGRVHASFNIGGTVTGRLSASEPNLQAIPKYGSMTAVRRTFRAPEGWLLLEADYSQLEIRVAALLSGDEELTRIYQEGRDMHAEVAALMFREGGAVETVSDEERFMAKAVNFGVLYGRSGWAISKGKEMTHAEEKLGMKRWSPEEAEDYVDSFLEGHPQLKEWIQASHERIMRTDSRYTETPFGRRRRFFVTRTDRGAIGALKRQAVNTPVQSVASDICLDAYARLWANIDPGEARLLSIVHDAILIEVREDRVAEIAAQVKELMEDPPIETKGVPFKVDIKAGRTLHDDDMKKVSG
jgi:DNA polymerase-1